MVMVELDISYIRATLTKKEEILGVQLQGKEVGLKRSTILTSSIFRIVLMALVEVDLGIGQAVLPTIIQVIMVYHQVL